MDEIAVEDLIADEDVAISITHSGYIKRTSITSYRAQKRGGRGRVGMKTKEEDFVADLFIASTHSYILIFTDRGRIHWLKVHEIPDVGPQGKGKAVVNLLQLQAGEKTAAVCAVRDFAYGGLRAARHAQGHREEDGAPRLLRTPGPRGSSPFGSTRATRSSTPSSPRGRTSSSSAPRAGWPSTSPRATCGPWAAVRTGSRG